MRHCKPAFMKHVFPRLYRPHLPFTALPSTKPMKENYQYLFSSHSLQGMVNIRKLIVPSTEHAHKTVYAKTFPSSQDIVTDKGQIFTCRIHFLNIQDNFSLMQLIYSLHCYYLLKVTKTSRLYSKFIFIQQQKSVFLKDSSTLSKSSILSLISPNIFQPLVWHSIFRIFLKNLLLFNCFHGHRVNHIMILI